jgi:hypothetical protein
MLPDVAGGGVRRELPQELLHCVREASFQRDRQGNNARVVQSEVEHFNQLRPIRDCVSTTAVDLFANQRLRFKKRQSIRGDDSTCHVPSDAAQELFQYNE